MSLRATMLLYSVMVGIVVVPNGAFAYFFTGFEQAFGPQLCKLAYGLHGTVGRALSAFAIAGIGVMILFKKISWATAVVFAMGLILITKAVDIGDYLMGSALPKTQMNNILPGVTDETIGTQEVCGAAIGVDLVKKGVNVLPGVNVPSNPLDTVLENIKSKK